MFLAEPTTVLSNPNLFITLTEHEIAPALLQNCFFIIFFLSYFVLTMLDLIDTVQCIFHSTVLLYLLLILHKRRIIFLLKKEDNHHSVKIILTI